MTFSGIPSGTVSQATYTEDGITATSPDNNFWGWPTAEQLHFDPDFFNNATYSFTFAGGPFDLQSFDVSYADSAGALANLTAYDAANAVINSGAFNVGSTGTLSFSGWTGISKLVVTNTVAHFSMDNLTLAAAGAVPEPATWAMMIAGFSLVGASMRRRRRASVSFA